MVIKTLIEVEADKLMILLRTIEFYDNFYSEQSTLEVARAVEHCKTALNTEGLLIFGAEADMIANRIRIKADYLRG